MIVDRSVRIRAGKSLATVIRGESIPFEIDVSSRPIQTLPENYGSLPLDTIAELAIDAIDEDGIFWLPMTRTPANAVFSTVCKAMPDRQLCMQSPPPDWDHVIIAIDLLPNWTKWLNNLAATRCEMKERGIPEHKLPALPEINCEGFDAPSPNRP